MAVTITACANSTPPDGTKIATCSIGGENYQLFIQTDAAGNTIGVAGSPFSASITNTPSVVVSSGSLVVTNALSASISNTLTASVIQSSPNTFANSWPIRITDTTDSVAVTTASEILVFVNNTASVIVSSGSVVVTNPVSASISGGSITVDKVNTQISASISGGSVALLTGANVFGTASVIQSTPTGISNAWPIKITDGTDTVTVTGASEQLVYVNNVLSTSVAGGSVAILAGTNIIGTASVIQSTPTGIANAWAIYIATNTGSILGMSNSPLAVAGDGQNMYWAGSLVSLSQVDLSSSISGCTRIIASAAGKAIVILNATYTTSSCQFIGWIASGAGAASVRIQTAMPFGTNGGMDAKRGPEGFLWSFPSGSNAVITTTSACNVAGTLNYIQIAS